jgi:diguanylate cyclase (GGDEF)-like protein/PAS domain S-box-containing protein
MSFFQDPEVFRTVLNSLPLGVYLVDRDLKIVFWNHGAEKISGFLGADLLGRVYRDKLLVQYDEGTSGPLGKACQLTEAMRDGAIKEADAYLLHKEGHRVPVHVCAVPLRSSDGKIIGAAESFGELKFPVVRGHRPSVHAQPYGIHQITGLPDPASTGARINEALAELKQHRVPFCVLCMQVDGLREFEAKHGKGPSEAAQRVVAHTLAHALRPDDFLGCWADHEFVAILRYCEKAGVNRVGDRVRNMVNCSEVDWWGDELSVTVSVGGAMAAENDNAGTLVARAQAALQHSTDEGGNCVTLAADETATIGKED